MRHTKILAHIWVAFPFYIKIQGRKTCVSSWGRNNSATQYWYNAKQCAAMQCDVVRCDAIRCSTMQKRCTVCLKQRRSLLPCPCPHLESSDLQDDIELKLWNVDKPLFFWCRKKGCTVWAHRLFVIQILPHSVRAWESITNVGAFAVGVRWGGVGCYSMQPQAKFAAQLVYNWHVVHMKSCIARQGYHIIAASDMCCTYW